MTKRKNKEALLNSISDKEVVSMFVPGMLFKFNKEILIVVEVTTNNVTYNIKLYNTVQNKIIDLYYAKKFAWRFYFQNIVEQQ